MLNLTGLVKELLKRLSNAAGQSAPSTSTGSTQESAAAAVTPKSQTAPENGRSVQSISTTISLLSTLCRGSPTITHVSYHFQFRWAKPFIHTQRANESHVHFCAIFRIYYVPICAKQWNVH